VTAIAVTEQDRRFAWGLAYRMTGSAADADDIAQEALVRLTVSPPPDTKRPLRPWLMRVTVNLAKDALRIRKRASYKGPWLPTPVDDAILEARDPSADAEERFVEREDALYAYLVALELLSPRERAVVVLREACELSIREVADVLNLSEANVKVIAHRASRRLEQEAPTTSVVRARNDPRFDAVERFVAALSIADVALVETLLLEDVVLTSDGGGEHFAARVPVIGRAKVAKLYVNLAKGRATTHGLALRVINGLPALVIEYQDERPGRHRNAILFDILSDGRIRRIFSVSASKKLGGLVPLP
jgi:RNA polymerase sigma-70 factor, ECF subfamily